MRKDACCTLCLSVNRRTINIFNTNLQQLYEKLANIKIEDDDCWMCYICHTRLHQCQRLQQLAVQTRGIIGDLCQNKFNPVFEELESLLDLSITINTTVILPPPVSFIKHEPDVKLEPPSDDGIEQEEVLKDTNEYKADEQPSCTHSNDDLSINDTASEENLSNVNENDTLFKTKVLKLNIRKLSQSNIDQYILPSHTTQYLDRAEVQCSERSIENVKIKQKEQKEIRVKGIEQDNEQDNTNNCEGRDHAGEAQSGCYKKPFSCDVCLKMFSYKSQLQLHMRIHTGDKPYSCDICSKKFSQKFSLNRHLTTHIADKPCSCDICSKKLKQKENLNRHQTTHIGDDKLYSCDICLKKFSRMFCLKQHLITHTGEKRYSCHICSRKFPYKAGLNYHLTTHRGDKPYSCDICSKKFSSRDHLIRHLNTHQDDKSYSCDICSKKFSRKESLNYHLTIHTCDKPYK